MYIYIYTYIHTYIHAYIYIYTHVHILMYEVAQCTAHGAKLGAIRWLEGRSEAPLGKSLLTLI